MWCDSGAERSNMERPDGKRILWNLGSKKTKSPLDFREKSSTSPYGGVPVVWRY